MPLQTNSILIHYGELYLKGKNRPVFISSLHQNLKQKLRSLGVTWSVHRPHSYLYVKVPPQDEINLERALAALDEVPGVAWYAPAHRISAQAARLATQTPDYEFIEKRSVELARDHYSPGAAFCVRVNRAEKRFPVSSAKIERRLGAAIIQDTPWDEVKLKDPDLTFYVNIKPEGIFLHTAKHRGMGGLPVGISGQVLTLLSGGIDSPVAAYLVAKRGCSMDFLHFTANPIQQSQAQDDKVAETVQRLSNITMRSRLYLVPSSYFQIAILGRQLDYELVIFRRFMTRIAEQLALQEGAGGLVVGDSLGQVASQTLDNIAACSQVATLPILRPLLTYDKQEIVELAKHIDTYQISMKPYKDCCSILARDPRARSSPESISRLEHAVLPEYETLISRTLEDIVCLKYEWGSRVG